MSGETKAPTIPGTPTRDLAAFASRLQYDVIPPAAIEHAKTCIIDNLGCVLYGSTLPWCQKLTAMITEEEGAPAATVWGTSMRTSASQAALANGTAGHAFELDDLHYTSLMHPGAVTVPAALAVAEKAGGVSGRELLAAIVAGYEVSTRIGQAMSQPHFFRGFHPQGTIGPFASAAAAGRVLRLDTEQMVHAFGITGSQSAGLMAAQEGSMVKRMHSGRACQSGVYGALLARLGFTGIVNVLEAPFGGFCTTLGGEQVYHEKLTAGLGEVWEILKVGFKAHAGCASIHTSLDAAQALRSEHNLQPDDVERVVAHTTTMTWVHCGWEYQPTGVTAAQMNLMYGVAAMLLEGQVFVEQYTEAKIRDPRILAFIKKVENVPDEDLDKAGPEGRHAAWMEIFTRDGRRLVKHVPRRKGSLENPMSRAEVIAKYRNLAGTVLPPQRMDQILDQVLHLEELEDVRTFARLLQA